tara:strand:+ start:6439 stop:6948 length:510 start_codon:yes stop_codon:yes gene_type:complete
MPETPIPLFGTTRTVPESGDTNWGDNVTGILTDVIKALNKMATLVGDVPFLLMQGRGSIQYCTEDLELPVTGNRIDVKGNTVVDGSGDDAAVTLGDDDPAVNSIADPDDTTVDGQTLLVVGTSDSATVRLDSDHPNIVINGDIVLSDNVAILLLWDSGTTNWVEVSRSN